MKKFIFASITMITCLVCTSNAQNWGLSLNNGSYWNNNGGYYNNNRQPTYIAPQYYVAPYGVTWQQRYSTPGPIIVPSYVPSYKNNQILIRPF